jgi:hypothetical protein
MLALVILLAGCMVCRHEDEGTSRKAPHTVRLFCIFAYCHHIAQPAEPEPDGHERQRAAPKD